MKKRIEYPRGGIHMAVDQTIDAMKEIPALYVRGSQIVRIDFSDGSIAPYTKTELQSLLHEHLEYKIGARVSAVPPDRVVAALHERGSWPLRRLVGVTLVPSLRLDGASGFNILSRPGFDPKTGFYYLGPEVELRPATCTDARAALASIFELAKDVVGTDPVLRAGWFSALLTLFVRPALSGSPLFFFDSELPEYAVALARSLGSIAGALHTYRNEQFMTSGEDFAKVISLVISRGFSAAILQSYIGARWSSPTEATLSALLPSPTYATRRYGSSVVDSLPNRAVWFATGVRPAIGPDLARRCMVIRGNPPSGYTAVTLGRFALHRDDIIRHVLTILSAALSSAPPMPSSPWLGFLGWHRHVAAVVEWLGLSVPPPLSHVRALAS